MANQINFYSFKQWCNDINHNDLLDLWDYELNDIDPDNIGYMSTKKAWLKCPRSLHDSSFVVLQNVVKTYNNSKEYHYCKACNSFGQFVIDNYGPAYLEKIWSSKNEKSPFEISRRAQSRIWLICQNDNTHPHYDLMTGNFVNSHNCPYCIGKRVCKTNSLGYNLPAALNIWSEKNEKTPYDYTPGSHDEVWWKCENNKHGDYKRMISRSVIYKLRCPECGRENQYNPSGPNHPNWKGDAVSEDRRIRWSTEYKDWRTSVYEKDSYTCQCCGVHGGDLNAHHLKDFANHLDLRFNVSNGITLCANCHDSTVEGSFHNLYGTHGKTESELQEYINNKRKQLGIYIPFDIDEYKNGNILMPNESDLSLGTWIFECFSPSENKIQ